MKRIRNVMGSSAYNARRIAQTERTRVQSQARYEQMLKLSESGVPLKKKWVARMDNRTRDTHAQLNGVVEELRKPFANGLLYPGDPNGPAKEVINCRCVLVPVVEGTKALPASPKHDILQSSTRETGKSNVHYVGKIDKRMYKAITEDIVGSNVIITDERIDHSNRHKNAYDKYGQYVCRILSDPDFIIRDKRPKSTILFRSIQEANRTIQLVLRLHVSDDAPEYQNSIISFWDIGEMRRNSYEKNGDIIYRRGDL